MQNLLRLARNSYERGKSLKLLIDLDGVVVDLHSIWLRIYNEEWGDSLSPDAVTTWDTVDLVKPACGVKVYDILLRPGIFAECKPIDGAIQGLKWLVEQGHEVLVVSTPPVGSKTAPSEKIEWVERYLPFLPGGSVILTAHKDLLEADALIEDSPANLAAWMKRGKLGVVFSRPWNRDVHGCVRLLSWDLNELDRVLGLVKQLQHGEHPIISGLEIPDSPGQHVQGLQQWFNRVHRSKYLAGQEEHGGQLWRKNTLPMLVEEIFDLVSYAHVELLHRIQLGSICDQVQAGEMDAREGIDRITNLLNTGNEEGVLEPDAQGTRSE